MALAIWDKQIFLGPGGKEATPYSGLYKEALLKGVL